MRKTLKPSLKKKDDAGALGMGFISSILTKHYEGKYQMTQFFQRFKFYEFENEMYFYQNCALRGNYELFMWGNYDRKRIALIFNHELFQILSLLFMNLKLSGQTHISL